VLRRRGVPFRVIGTPRNDKTFRLAVDGVTAIETDIFEVRRQWSSLSHQMQCLRDNPEVAAEEYQAIADDPLRSYVLTFDPKEAPRARPSARRPKVAILREQGVNGHVEMAAAFTLAGFEAVDVHMSDLAFGRASLEDFVGLAACGGFSYGDVLGAGAGWAGTILHNPRLRAMFETFFKRPDTFTLGVCNGCQMLSRLKDLIPGASHWPTFFKNKSSRFECRYVTVEVLPSPSVLLAGMAGSLLPVPVAHREGLAVGGHGVAALRFVDNHGAPTERYPYNPNGSPGGVTGFTSEDGRALIMMPHPERAFRAVQLSWQPPGLFEGESGPWMRLFQNAYAFASRSVDR